MASKTTASPLQSPVKQPTAFRTGADLLKFVTETLDIPSKKLTNYCGFTNKSYRNWQKVKLDDAKGMLGNLKRLPELLAELAGWGATPSQIRYMLTRPISRDENRTILHHVTMGTELGIVKALLEGMMAQPIGQVSSTPPSAYEKIKSKFGTVNNDTLRRVAREDPQLLQALEYELDSYNSLTDIGRAAVAQAFGYTKNPILIGRLRKYLQSPEVYLREAAVYGLSAFIEDDIEVDRIVQILRNHQDDDEDINEAIREALEALGVTPIIPEPLKPLE